MIEERGVKVEPFRLLDHGFAVLIQVIKELINHILKKSSVRALWQTDTGMGQLHDLVSIKVSLTAHIEQSEFLSVQSEGIRLSLSELLLIFRTEMV